MAKPAPASGEAPEPAPAAAETMALDHFCLSASQTDRRVELLGGFHASETAAGRTADTREAFAARLKAFANAPA